MNKMKTMVSVGALAVTAWAAPAVAAEGYVPYLTGNSVGAPTGAAPPPGVYGANSVDFFGGPIVDQNGNNVPGQKIDDAIDVPVLLWVPNFKILGASYNVALIQPYMVQTIQDDHQDVGSHDRSDPGYLGLGNSAEQNGIFNTIIVPYNLSWNVRPGWFVSTGLGIYIPDGTYSDSPEQACFAYLTTHSNGHQYCHVSATNWAPVAWASGRVANLTAIGNNTWDFEPDIAVSYLVGGWNISGKALIDFQTENMSTDYQTGPIFTFDWTVAHKFGKWEAGVGGSFVQQLANDSGWGALIAHDGTTANTEVSLIELGPVVSYDFGPVTLQTKVLLPAEAENYVKPTQVYLTAIWGF